MDTTETHIVAQLRAENCVTLFKVIHESRIPTDSVPEYVKVCVQQWAQTDDGERTLAEYGLTNIDFNWGDLGLICDAITEDDGWCDGIRSVAHIEIDHYCTVEHDEPLLAR